MEIDLVEENRVAVIYCRIPSRESVAQGQGLFNQETRCRWFADKQGYEVANVFRDMCSGATITRPGMEELLKNLKKMGRRSTVVIVDDAPKIARKLVDYEILCARVSAVGGIILYPNIN